MDGIDFFNRLFSSFVDRVGKAEVFVGFSSTPERESRPQKAKNVSQAQRFQQAENSSPTPCNKGFF